MTHRAVPSFWTSYRRLPARIQRQADDTFDLLKQSPRHPSLHLKKVGAFWSVRIGIGWRAVARQEDGDLYWFFIGTHAEYDKLLGR